MYTKCKRCKVQPKFGFIWFRCDILVESSNNELSNLLAVKRVYFVIGITIEPHFSDDFVYLVFSLIDMVPPYHV